MKQPLESAAVDGICTGLQCRCGLTLSEANLPNGLCRECRLARILTQFDRPSTDQLRMSNP